MKVIKLVDKGYVVRYAIIDEVSDWLPEEINFTAWSFFQLGGGCIPFVFIGEDNGVFPVISREINTDDAHRLLERAKKIAEYSKTPIEVVDKTR